mgnify:CR=1 FL=1
MKGKAKMKKVLAIVLALAMVFALCACGNGGNNGGDDANKGNSDNNGNEQAKDFYTDQIDVNGIDAKGKKIVYIAPSLDIEYWQWVEDGVRQACEEYGVSVEVYVSNNSAADQAENGETAVIQGADAVVLSPVSSDSCSTVLDACEDAGIPVTIAAIGSTADNYYAFISADDYTSMMQAFTCATRQRLWAATRSAFWLFLWIVPMQRQRWQDLKRPARKRVSPLHRPSRPATLPFQNQLICAATF